MEISNAMLVLFIKYLILLSSSVVLSTENVHSLDDNVVFINPNISTGSVFEKMSIDPSTSRIFVGGVNILLDIFNTDLSIRKYVQTGPKDDSPLCQDARSKDGCNVQLSKTNSHTKAMAVYDKSSKLIECSNLYQGRCRIRNLHNIADVLAESIEPRISNDSSSSVVLFVGSGPINMTSESVLYVGASTTNGDHDRMSIFSLFLRQNKAFELVYPGLYGGTHVSLDYRSRGYYKYQIDYVGGFEAGDYAYFVTRQRKAIFDESNIQSRLVRVCTGDKFFHSYTEVPLKCSKNGVDYNLVQDVYVAKAGYELAKSMDISSSESVVFGVFWEGDKNTYRAEEPTGRSAICVFTMAEVESAFKQNVMNCYKGAAGLKKNLPWFSSNDDCRATTLPWEGIKCGKDVNSRIGGTEPISVTATFTTENEHWTAIAVNTTRSVTVAFVGTDTGNIHKILIESRDSAEKYSTESLTKNEPILADIEISGDGKHLYVLTPTKVIKMPTSKCESSASTCDDCLKQRDPYCGWCVKSNQCFQEEACEREVPHTTFGWLEFQNSKCPLIKSINPDKMQIDTQDHLNVTIENVLAAAEKRMQCVFRFPDGETFLSEPMPFNGHLKCSTPSKDKLPLIPKNRYHLDSELIVVSEGSKLALASTNFSFYDCTRYSSCSSCTSSSFPCDWCMESNECVTGKSTEDKCRKQNIVNGLNREGTSSRKGPSKCPHIVSPISKMTISTGEKRKISVKVENADMPFMEGFGCVFRNGKDVHEKKAVRIADDTITCDEMLFEAYNNINSGLTVFDFNVFWTSDASKKHRYLDNVEELTVNVYSCEFLASNCGRCLTLDSDKYDCGWCTSDEKCSRSDSCPIRTPSNWLSSTDLCPNPIIENFEPKKGTVNGGTKVMITGINLGRRVSDVMKAVQIANIPCDIISEGYVPSSTILCSTGKSLIKGSNSRGVVAITLRHDSAKYFAHSTDHFTYVDPVVTSLKPTRGPRTGGTDITLTGTDLDASSDVEVRFGNVPCNVTSRNTSSLICRITPSSSNGVFPLHISFDNTMQRLPIPINFEFTSEPSVQAIFPNKTIPSGGILTDVRGQGFTLLQRPRIVFLGTGNARFAGPPCEVVDDQLMRCSTPAFPIKKYELHRDAEKMVDFVFDFDGAEFNRSRIKLMPSPTFEMFSETRFIRPGDDSLTLNGNNLNLVATERDIVVTVGGERCNLTALANKVLTCSPPEKKPKLVGKLEPEVVVTIGNMSFTVGELSYDAPGLSSSLFFVIIIFILIMISLIICLVILYRRKTSTHHRQMKYLKTQMDTIEMKVATECKEAFAELQTSLNQYTADLPSGTPTAPFLAYKDYCAKVLFPNCNKNHPVLKNLEVDTHKADTIEAGLREFHKLILNKTFFLTFVRTMESNKYFVGKDRVYVGSLLMVVLQEKMGYCTEMLKHLLRELIEKTVEKKFQPKILFRRSESIAERMLAAWFTFLLHNHLEEFDAGKRLYELYWGIKQQMEKGPQDAITLEARYSLSEEKLLRATFEYKELTILIATTDSLYTQPEIPVRVLDCDTISQVKEKCLDIKYRGYRYSDRPSASDLQLEWKTGMNGRMILQDVDYSSRSEHNGWKRLNTLAHYNIPNNSVFYLTSKNNSLYNLSVLSDRSEKSSTSLKNTNSPKPWGSNVQSSTPSSNMNEDNGFKLYHLVKPSEHGPSENQEKMVTEIYLTRLLMMKGTLQTFINDLLVSIFSTKTYAAPACIKYMFDFMDEQAVENGITDPEVVHAWKSNSLPLRFWVNLIKNPHFLFDIQKPTKVEGCLSVVAQTLMDACSTQDHQLTKDSPSSKLLFAKDIYQFRDLVDCYFTDVSQAPPIDEAEMGQILSSHSRQHVGEFHVFSALSELYKYLDQYKESIMDALEVNEHAQASRLPGRLQDLLALMESDYYRATDYESSTLGLGYNSNSRLMSKDRI